MARLTVDQKIAMTKDMILFFGGLAGIAYQQLTGNVNFVLLAIFTVMVGLPGLTNLIPLMRGSITNSQSSLQVPPLSDTDSQNVS